MRSFICFAALIALTFAAYGSNKQSSAYAGKVNANSNYYGADASAYDVSAKSGYGKDYNNYGYGKDYNNYGYGKDYNNYGYGKDYNNYGYGKNYGSNYGNGQNSYYSYSEY
eukprot:TRINITY_DN62_c1_g2_i3.p1 TRINITY_DN62_c1_g2~~TRINITY_DN62_c1_g2_i3.p1  ORF type:complete len:111 (-),score=34.47 TRINITY_DN62_c1_g2_i3:72-404(-)